MGSVFFKWPVARMDLSRLKANSTCQRQLEQKLDRLGDAALTHEAPWHNLDREPMLFLENGFDMRQISVAGGLRDQHGDFVKADRIFLGVIDYQ